MVPLAHALLATIFAYSVGNAAGVRKRNHIATHDTAVTHMCEVTDTMGLGLRWQFAIIGSALNCRNKCIKVVYEPKARDAAFEKGFLPEKDETSGLCHCRLKNRTAVLPPLPNMNLCDDPTICWSIYKDLSGISKSGSTNIWRPNPDACPPCEGEECNSVTIDKAYGEQEIADLIKKGRLPPNLMDIYVKPKTQAPTEAPTDAPTEAPTEAPSRTLRPTPAPSNHVWFEGVSPERVMELLKRKGSVLKPAELEDQWCTGLALGGFGPITAVLKGTGGDKACNANFVGRDPKLCTDLFGSGDNKISKVVEKNERVAFFDADGCDCSNVTNNFPKRTSCIFSVSEKF